MLVIIQFVQVFIVVIHGLLDIHCYKRIHDIYDSLIMIISSLTLWFPHNILS